MGNVTFVQHVRVEKETGNGKKERREDGDKEKENVGTAALGCPERSRRAVRRTKSGSQPVPCTVSRQRPCKRQIDSERFVI
jgi:hypothetical protein